MSQFAQHHVVPNQENATMAPTGSDTNLWVEFYTRANPHPNLQLSDEAGYAVYDDIPWVRIYIPGDRTKDYDRPAKLDFEGPNDQVPPDPQRFPRQWAAFQTASTKVNVGFPIEEWGAITRTEAENFKRNSIHTVEQLAGLPDTSLTWLGARARRDQAKAWLETAKNHAGEAKLAKQVEQLEAQNAALQAQLREVLDRLGEDEPNETTKRRGRPPKTQE